AGQQADPRSAGARRSAAPARRGPPRRRCAPRLRRRARSDGPPSSPGRRL
ncbi:MAG: hypothetical protein AVDCRST_MAG49-3483, partial [uncultured Thermomicrobiales bacterium]